MTTYSTAGINTTTADARREAIRLAYDHTDTAAAIVARARTFEAYLLGQDVADPALDALLDVIDNRPASSTHHQTMFPSDAEWNWTLEVISKARLLHATKRPR